MNSEYMSRFVTAETAAKAVKSGDWVDFGFGTGFPELMDKALAARAGVRSTKLLPGTAGTSAPTRERNRRKVRSALSRCCSARCPSFTGSITVWTWR